MIKPVKMVKRSPRAIVKNEHICGVRRKVPPDKGPYDWKVAGPFSGGSFIRRDLSPEDPLSGGSFIRRDLSHPTSRNMSIRGHTLRTSAVWHIGRGGFGISVKSKNCNNVRTNFSFSFVLLKVVGKPGRLGFLKIRTMGQELLHERNS